MQEWLHTPQSKPLISSKKKLQRVGYYGLRILAIDRFGTD